MDYHQSFVKQYRHNAGISKTRLLLQQLYNKIEDLKIVEDILAQPEAPPTSSSPSAMRVIKQLQHEISSLSEQLVNATEETYTDDSIVV